MAAAEKLCWFVENFGLIALIRVKWKRLMMSLPLAKEKVGFDTREVLAMMMLIVTIFAGD